MTSICVSKEHTESMYYHTYANVLENRFYTIVYLSKTRLLCLPRNKRLSYPLQPNT